MRLDIKSADRLHMLVWRGRCGDRSWLDRWLSGVAVNGIPVGEIRHHDTFEEALNAALDRAGLR